VYRERVRLDMKDMKLIISSCVQRESQIGHEGYEADHQFLCTEWEKLTSMYCRVRLHELLSTTQLPNLPENDVVSIIPNPMERHTNTGVTKYAQMGG
jgi:hypothetical protein